MLTRDSLDWLSRVKVEPVCGELLIKPRWAIGTGLRKQAKHFEHECGTDECGAAGGIERRSDFHDVATHEVEATKPPQKA